LAKVVSPAKICYTHYDYMTYAVARAIPYFACPLRLRSGHGFDCAQDERQLDTLLLSGAVFCALRKKRHTIGTESTALPKAKR
jgi:hypothetical protein